MEVAQILVARDGAGSAHHLHAVAHVGAVEHGLLVVGVEVLEADSGDVAQPVAEVEAVAGVDVGRDAEVVAVGVEHTPCIACALRLHLREDEPFVGRNLLVGLAAVVQAEDAFDAEALKRRERERVGGLEALDVGTVVLQPLGVADECLEDAVLLVVHGVDVGVEVLHRAVGSSVAQVVGRTALRGPPVRCRVPGCRYGCVGSPA